MIYFIHNRLFYIYVILILFSAVSCQFDRNPIVSEGYRRVRCEKNRYYIKNLCEDEEEYLDWATGYDQHKKFQDLSSENLREIVQQTKDVDKAAALFYVRALSEPQNRDFMEYLIRNESHFSTERPDLSGENITLVLVPGMFYQDNVEIEADGDSLRKTAESIGMKTQIIPVKQTGTVETNARIICEFLSQRSSPERFIIASVSKGSSDFKMATQVCPSSKSMSRVIGWLNIGGINRGSRLIEAIDDSWLLWAEARLYFFLRRYEWKGLLSLRYSPANPLSIDSGLPNGMVVINVIGVPLFRHVTQRARPFYEYLIEKGPNDGINLLGDSTLPGTITYPAWRNDHYFQWKIPEEHILAALVYISGLRKVY